MAAVPIDVDGSAVPRWSPDGSHLLVGSFSSLGLRPAIAKPDGTDLNVLPVPGLPSAMDMGPCVWAPPGGRVLCDAQNFANADHRFDGIYSMSTAGVDLRRLTVNPYPPGGCLTAGRKAARFSSRTSTEPVCARSRITACRTHMATASPAGLLTAQGPRSRALPAHSSQSNLTASGWLPCRSAAAAGRTFAVAPGWSPDGTRFCPASSSDPRVDPTPTPFEPTEAI